MKTLDYETLGVGFGRKTLKLYKRKPRYRRHAAVLADMLIKTGMEAGALIVGLNTLPGKRERLEQVNTCLALVDKTVYAAYVMAEEEIYRYSYAKDLFKYAEQTTKFLLNERDILTSALNTETIAAPAYKPEPIYRSVAPKPVVIGDEDGFNEVYDPSVYD